MRYDFSSDEIESLEKKALALSEFRAKKTITSFDFLKKNANVPDIEYNPYIDIEDDLIIDIEGYWKNEFEALENKYLDRLEGDPEKIVEDALGVFEDGVCFILAKLIEESQLLNHTNRVVNIEAYVYDATEEDFLLSINDLRLAFYPERKMEYYFAPLTLMNRIKKPSNLVGKKYLSQVRVNADSLETVINTSVLNKHYEALKGKPEYIEKLKKAVHYGIVTNEYVTQENSKRKPLPSIELYRLLNSATQRKSLVSIFPETSVLNQNLNGQMEMHQMEDKYGNNKYLVSIGLTQMSFDGSALRNGKITQFDMSVYEAICNARRIYERNGLGKCIVTIREIYRIMTGSNGSKKNISDVMMKKIRDSIDKMRFTRIVIDISQEAQYLSLLDKENPDERMEHAIKTGCIDTYFLEASWIHFTTEKGTRTEGLYLPIAPILDTYYEAKGHILYIPYNYLDMSATIGRIQNPEIVLGFSGYLLRRIAWMNENGKQPGTIKLETIYSDTGIPRPSEIDKRRELTGVDKYSQAKSEKKLTEASLNNMISTYTNDDIKVLINILDSFKSKGFIRAWHFEDNNSRVVIERNPVQIIENRLNIWKNQGTINSYDITLGKEGTANTFVIFIDETKMQYTKNGQKKVPSEISKTLANWENWQYIKPVEKAKNGVTGRKIKIVAK